MQKFSNIINKIRIRIKNVYFRNKVHGKIGENTLIGKNTLIDINSFVGNETFINDNCIITKASIGNYCSIGANVVIGPGEHSLKKISNSARFYSNAYEDLTKKPCNIGHDVWIGTYAIIMRGVNIGNGAVIGADAVVTKDVPPFAIVAGVPAKIIKFKFSEDVIEIIMTSKWWNMKFIEAKKEITRLGNLCGIK